MKGWKRRDVMIFSAGACYLVFRVRTTPYCVQYLHNSRGGSVFHPSHSRRRVDFRGAEGAQRNGWMGGYILVPRWRLFCGGGSAEGVSE